MKHGGKEKSGSSAATAESWANRLRRGEVEAVGQVRARVQRILAFRGLSIPQEERGDLEQEIMTQVWQAVNRTGFDATAGFWGFVEVVASRRCIDWFRTRREILPLQPDLHAPDPDPLQETLKNERLALAANSLAALDPTCRKLISLHLEEKKSYRELAQILGKSEGALRVQMYRCVQSARKILRKLEKTRARQKETQPEAARPS
jgi:RNA polymerase sigma factor (sigma-70 family)